MSTTTATSRPARRRSPAPPAGMAGLLLALAAAIPATIPAAEGGGTDVVTQPSYTPMWNDYDINSGVAAVGANKLHDIGIVGQGVTAALVESGFNTDHEIFDGKIVNNYTGPGGDHGTHVAGTVAAMAPGAMLWLDNYTGGNTVNAYETIAANAAQYNIAAVNNSWSGTINGRYLTPAEVEAAYPDIAAAVQELLNEEVAVVGSSGNWGVNDRLNYPNGLPGVVAAGALNPHGYIRPSSTQYDKGGLFLVAPGEDILSATSVDANGESLYGVMNGTSMAAAHVTGAITLLRSGARMATADEIIASLYDSAQLIPYDGDAVVPREHVGGHNPYYVRENLAALAGNADIARYTEFLDAVIGKYNADSVTMDEWRLLSHIEAVYAYCDNNGYDIGEFISVMRQTGDLTPLRATQYGYIQVDEAFKDLTHDRTDKIAEGLAPIDRGLASVIRAYADELAAELGWHSAQVFQRFDALDERRQLELARQMSPRFADDVTQSAHLGIARMHGALGRRTELHRIDRGLASGDGGAPAVDFTPCNIAGFTFSTWSANFGGAFDQDSGHGPRRQSYDGHFYGGSFGGEARWDIVTAGIFGNVAHHYIDSADGKAEGDWATIGLYGRLDFASGFFEGSGLLGYGDYDMKRRIRVPGVIFTGSQPGEYVLDWASEMYEKARSDYHMYNWSLRLAGGYDFWQSGGWIAGVRGEATLSHNRMKHYTEHGAESFNLKMKRYDTVYLEGGAGVFAARNFGCDRPVFTAMGKVMGMAGGTLGGRMYGGFAQYGGQFRYDPDHRVTGWVAPEFTLSWHVTERFAITGGYQGRFGRDYSEHAGSLDFDFHW